MTCCPAASPAASEAGEQNPEEQVSDHSALGEQF
jgi:hypothetical protein